MRTPSPRDNRKQLNQMECFGERGRDRTRRCPEHPEHAAKHNAAPIAVHEIHDLGTKCAATASLCANITHLPNKNGVP